MFENEIEQLALLQQKRNEVNERLQAARALFDVQHKTLIDAAAELSQQISDLDNDIRARALKAFESTGEKKLHPAVGVRESRRGDWPEQAALDYCIGKRRDLLALKRANYEKALKSDERDPDQPGEIIVSAGATISKDLTPYLPKQHDPAMFEFLTELQLSGEINMLAAPPKLAERFDLEIEAAREVFWAWAELQSAGG